MSRKKTPLHPYAPYWFGLLFVGLTVVTIPWNLYLAIKLPPDNLSSHWDVAWVGFDIGLTIAMAATAWFAIIKSKFLIIASTVTASMLMFDAWFDVITAHRGYDFIQSLVLAVFFEIPLALVCLRLSYLMLERDFRR